MNKIIKKIGSSLEEEQEIAERVVSYIREKSDHFLPIFQRYRQEWEKRILAFDVYLPEGCPALGFEGRTVIELKNRLGADTPYRYFEYFETVLSEVGIQNFILIYNDKNKFPQSLLQRFMRYRRWGFYVYSVSTFCKGKSKQERHEVEPLQELSDEEKKKRFIEDAHTAFISGRNTLFLGAGVSCSADVPKWDDFLSELLDRDYASSIRMGDYQSVNKACDHSSIISGRYIENRFTSEDEFKKEMANVLYKNKPKPDSKLFEELVQMICSSKSMGRNCVDQVITFNYDDLLETALEHSIRYHSIFDRTIYTGNDFPIYHVHGMIPQKRPIKSTPVLGEKNYHQLYRESFHWSNVVQLFALTRSTCFFIGLSMNDPNLRRLLDISRNGAGIINEGIESIEPKHYAIMERKSLDENNPVSYKDNEHIENMEQMMEQLGINIIWYDNPPGSKHSEVPKILKAIRTGII